MASKTFNLVWGETGATLFYQVVDNANGTLVARTGSGIIEFPAGSGLYIATIDPWTTSWSGRIIWDDGAGNYAEESFVGFGAPTPADDDTGTDAAYVGSTSTLIATIPPAMLPALLDSSNADFVDMALAMASDRIDSLRFQGRKFDNVTPQARQFPRVAYESGLPIGGLSQAIALGYPQALSVADTIWDPDPNDPTAAIVPNNVKLACIFEADSILAGDRDRILKAQHDGLIQQTSGGMSEQFRADALTRWGGELCRNARMYLVKYQLTTGQIR